MTVDFHDLSTLANPLPHPEGVAFLHQALRHKVQESLISLFAEVQRVLKLPVHESMDLVRQLDTSQRFSPLLYLMYFTLLEAMEQQEVKRVNSAIEKFQAVKNDAYYSRDDWGFISDPAHPAIHYYIAHHLAATNEKETFEPLESEEFLNIKEKLYFTFRVLEKTDRASYLEIKNIVSAINITKGKFRATAATSFGYFGMILLRLKALDFEPESNLYLFDSLVHEAAHIYLNLLMAFDPLVLNPQESCFSPARYTNRPLKGVLHAHFVFFRLIKNYLLSEKIFSDIPVISSKKGNQNFNIPIAALPFSYVDRLEAYQRKFNEGRKTIEQHAQFTPVGREFFDAMSHEIRCST